MPMGLVLSPLYPQLCHFIYKISSVVPAPRVLVRGQLVTVAKKLGTYRCSVKVGSLSLVDSDSSIIEGFRVPLRAVV